jgi:hypothetical protein
MYPRDDGEAYGLANEIFFLLEGKYKKLNVTFPEPLLRPANYSDTNPRPKAHPNVVIRILAFSLYYAGLNKTDRQIASLYRQNVSKSYGGLWTGLGHRYRGKAYVAIA